MMIALCTGKPVACERGETEQILVTFPSGKTDVQVALSLNQALHLAQVLRQATVDALDRGFATPPANEAMAKLLALPARPS